MSVHEWRTYVNSYSTARMWNSYNLYRVFCLTVEPLPPTMLITRCQQWCKRHTACQAEVLVSHDSVLFLQARVSAAQVDSNRVRRLRRSAETLYTGCIRLELGYCEQVVRYWLLLRGSIVQSVTCTVTILYSIVRPHLRSNHSWFIHQSSLANTSTHLVAKRGETCQEMSVNFASEVSLSYSVGIFTMP
jgi:predicted DNA-binding helix-hairpin-helix protein